jgi:hypothetical protein
MENTDMTHEDQKSINDWITETFGEAGSNFSVASRANQEMSELLMALAVDDFDPKAVEEAADIVIVLYRLAERLGADLMAEVDRKMLINRSRQWNVAHGHGYHVKDQDHLALPSDVIETLLAIGPVEWGRTHNQNDGKHIDDLENTLKLTRQHFGIEVKETTIHGVYLAGTATVLAHTGMSPNSPQHARILVGAWNQLVEAAKSHLQATA